MVQRIKFWSRTNHCIRQLREESGKMSFFSCESCLISILPYEHPTHSPVMSQVAQKASDFLGVDKSALGWGPGDPGPVRAMPWV